jgi:hypothetical protein
MREGDAVAAARRRLPMVQVDGATPLIGEHGTVTLLDAFEGRFGEYQWDHASPLLFDKMIPDRV